MHSLMLNHIYVLHKLSLERLIIILATLLLEVPYIESGWM
jgi:hypothetical protein